MDKKILYVASTFAHIKNFHLTYLKHFKDSGYVVHVMGGKKTEKILYADKVFNIPFEKSMFSMKNLFYVLKILRILRMERYEIVSVHTTLAAFFTRLSILISKYKPKLVINTVHGYLFGRNTNIIKKILFIMAEKILASTTDITMVMNKEDFYLSKKYKLYGKQLHLIEGMGVDFSKFFLKNKTNENLRYELNIKHSDFVMIFVGEFSKRKNQTMLINAMSDLSSDVKLILLGDGGEFLKCKALAKKINVSDRITFTGYIKNIADYYDISDVCVCASRSEGLPFNVMEAMYFGLPIIASRTKGQEDLVHHGVNGFLFHENNIKEFCGYVNILKKNTSLSKMLGDYNKDTYEQYSIEKAMPNIIKKMDKKY